MGPMIVLGTIAGVGIATLGVNNGNLFVATMALGVVEVVTMVVLVATVDEGRQRRRARSHGSRSRTSAWAADILRECSVLWLLLVRLLFLGAYNATLLACPTSSASHGMSEADADTTVFIGTAIVGVITALAAIPGARLRDRFGRRPVIWAAAADRRLGPARRGVRADAGRRDRLVRPVRHRHGTFLSVDWALMTDVIPKDTAGRYMGILNAGTAMAEPVFLLVAGPLALDLLGRLFGEPFGPRATMLVAVVFLVGAGLALTRVDARRREREDRSPADRAGGHHAGGDAA